MSNIAKEDTWTQHTESTLERWFLMRVLKVGRIRTNPKSNQHMHAAALKPQKMSTLMRTIPLKRENDLQILQRCDISPHNFFKVHQDSWETLPDGGGCWGIWPLHLRVNAVAATRAETPQFYWAPHGRIYHRLKPSHKIRNKKWLYSNPSRVSCQRGHRNYQVQSFNTWH